MIATGAWIDAPATQAVCAMLEDAGHQALLVGGCVRNALLGVPVSDIDIATDARPEQVIALAEASDRKAIPTGIEHGTITVVEDDTPFEITTFRKDVETDGRRATVAFADCIEEDARRRDFTMNAIYARHDGTIIDPLDGLPDLKARHIRFIDDAEQRIREDYLRILRFFRFFAHFGDPKVGLDEEGLAACAALADGIEVLSRERVGLEMLKLLEAIDPSPAVASMEQSGILQRVLSGASGRTLAPLVHVETLLDLKPDALRRLACLGGERSGDQLRLSKKKAKRLSTLRDNSVLQKSSGELGYRYGEDLALDIMALHAALAEREPDLNGREKAQTGARAIFPIKACDLEPGLQGKALGEALSQLEQTWIDSEFSISREALLKNVS